MPGESLKVTSGPAAGRVIEVAGDLVLGRSVDGPGAFEDDAELSRRHAQISVESEEYLSLKDLGSRNGTFLNGTRLTEVQVLQAGDTIRIGTTTLLVEARRADQPTLAAGGQETVLARPQVTTQAAPPPPSPPPAPPPPPTAAPVQPQAAAAPQQVQPFPPLPGAQQPAAPARDRTRTFVILGWIFAAIALLFPVAGIVGIIMGVVVIIRGQRQRTARGAAIVAVSILCIAIGAAVGLALM